MKEKTRNTSARKKLVPAVAMLTTSAIMLSSATYAWFTLNKEVEVTGLQMAAVAGDSLEITLGGLGVKTGQSKTGATPTNTTFGSVDDLGWGRSEIIDSYYSVIGKIKPASSSTALSVYKVDENKVYAGGQAVETDATVSLLGETDMSYIKLDVNYDTEDLTNESVNGSSDEGYYVDIPMWIRTSNSEGRDVNAYVRINDPNTGNGSDLINAVRVALIPVAGVTDLSAGTAVTALTYSKTGSYTVPADLASSATIFGLTDDTYNGKVLANEGTYSGDGVLVGTDGITIVKAADTFTTDTNGFVAKNGEATLAGTSIFTMPEAQKDKYAAVLVVARVWIEGESTHCNDATANQDWNIDFHFELADAASST